MKKIFIVLISFVLMFSCVFSFSACNSYTSSTSQDPPKQQTARKLTSISSNLSNYMCEDGVLNIKDTDVVDKQFLNTMIQTISLNYDDGTQTAIELSDSKITLSYYKSVNETFHQSSRSDKLQIKYGDAETSFSVFYKITAWKFYNCIEDSLFYPGGEITKILNSKCNPHFKDLSLDSFDISFATYRDVCPIFYSGSSPIVYLKLGRFMNIDCDMSSLYNNLYPSSIDTLVLYNCPNLASPIFKYINIGKLVILDQMEYNKLIKIGMYKEYLNKIYSSES